MLAALHFNENVNQEQKVDADGDPQWPASYPKHRGGDGVLKEVNIPCTMVSIAIVYTLEYTQIQWPWSPLGIYYWNVICFKLNLNISKSPLVEEMTSHQTGDKPSFKPVISQFTDVHTNVC